MPDEIASGESGPVLSLRPIGVIHSPWRAKEEAPLQGASVPDAQGTVEVFAEFEAGLKDVEGFTHLFLLYWLDRAGETSLVRAPFLDDAPHGLFATRHPARPNPIGLTVVRLLRRDGRRLYVSGVDALDGTPLLDIKPYVPRWDSVPDAVAGWLQDRPDRPKPAGRE